MNKKLNENIYTGDNNNKKNKKKYKKHSISPFVSLDAGDVEKNNEIFNKMNTPNISSDTGNFSNGESMGEAFDNDQTPTYTYSYVGPVYRFERVYDVLKEPVYTDAKSAAHAANMIKGKLKRRYGFDMNARLDIDMDKVEKVEYDDSFHLGDFDYMQYEDKGRPEYDEKDYIDSIDGKDVYFVDGYYRIDGLDNEFISEEEIRDYLEEIYQMNEYNTNSLFYGVDDDQSLNESLKETVQDNSNLSYKQIIEKLNKIDMYCIDEDLEYHNLKNLFEDVSQRLSPKDKEEIKKVIQSTDDANTIAAVLAAKAEDKNESLEDNDSDYFMDNDEGTYEVFLYGQNPSVRHTFAYFDTEQEAEDFCNEHDWEYIDPETKFDWNMDYRYVPKQSFSESLSNGLKNKLDRFIKTSSSDYSVDNIKLYITPKGNINIRTLDNKDIVTVGRNQFTDSEIEELREDGYLNDYDQTNEGYIPGFGEMPGAEIIDGVLTSVEEEDDDWTPGMYDPFSEDDDTVKESAFKNHYIEDTDNRSSYKIRFYKLSGNDKGNLDHEEFFDSKEDAVRAYRKVFKKELYSLNPTVWQNVDGEWKRLLNSELTEARDLKKDIYYIIKDRQGHQLSTPNKDDQELWDRVESMDPNGRRGLCVVVYKGKVESLNEDGYEEVISDLESIEKFLIANDFSNYEVFDYQNYPMGTSKIDFEVSGDWRHDHLLFKHLLQEWADKNNRKIFKIESEEVGNSESDDYEAIYHVYIAKDDESFDKLNSMKSLFEDTVKQNGKWVNKGKEGTHGKFVTKKAADAQRKAMFANRYKAENLNEDSENSVFYPNGMEVPENSVDMDMFLDYNFGTDRDRDNSHYTTEEKQKSVDYWFKVHEPGPFEENVNETLDKDTKYVMVVDGKVVVEFSSLSDMNAYRNKASRNPNAIIGKFIKVEDDFKDSENLNEDSDYFTNLIDTNDIDVIDEFLNSEIDTAYHLLDYKKLINELYDQYVSDYKKFPKSNTMDSLDQKYSRDHGRFYEKWKPVIDKCKEIIKSSSVSGYGKFDAFVLKLIDKLKSMEYNFPYGWKTEVINEALNNEDKEVYINIIKEAEDREDLEDIVHEIFFYDKPLFVKIRHFPKDKSFEEIRDHIIEVIQGTLNESESTQINELFNYEGAINYLESNGVSADPTTYVGEYVCDLLDDCCNEDELYEKGSLDHIIERAHKEFDFNESLKEDTDLERKRNKEIDDETDKLVKKWEKEHNKKIDAVEEATIRIRVAKDWDKKHKMKEDYQKEDDSWGEPYTYDDVEKELKKLTNNWKDDEGTIRCYYEQEKEFGKQILKKHYKIVETSDGRTESGEKMSWVISYSKSKKDNEINESFEASSKSLRDEIYDYLDDIGGYADYNQKIEDVAEDFDLPFDEAEGYVCDWIQDPERGRDLEWIHEDRQECVGSASNTDNKKYITESITSNLQDAIIDCIDWFILMEMDFPKDSFLADSWEDLKDGIEMGMDPEFEVAEGIIEYFKPIVTFNKRYNKEVEEEGVFADEIELYQSLVRAMNNFLAKNGYEDRIEE